MGFGVYGKIYRSRDDEEESFKIKKINKDKRFYVPHVDISVLQKMQN